MILSINSATFDTAVFLSCDCPNSMQMSLKQENNVSLMPRYERKIENHSIIFLDIRC